MERFGEAALDILGMRRAVRTGMPGAIDNGRFEQNLRHSLMWVISIGTTEIQRGLIRATRARTARDRRSGCRRSGDRAPLAGMRVLDFSIMVAGPYCARLLADVGAEVIKIEPPEGDDMRLRTPPRDGHSTYFGQLNAGKAQPGAGPEERRRDQAGASHGRGGGYHRREFPTRRDGSSRSRL